MSGKQGVYDCDNCDEQLQNDRNCKGRNENVFMFQVGYDSTAKHNKRQFIRRCPLAYINSVSFQIWKRYQECKLKKELGILVETPNKFLFEAFGVIALSCQEYDEFKRDEEEKKRQRESKRRGR